MSIRRLEKMMLFLGIDEVDVEELFLCISLSGNMRRLSYCQGDNFVGVESWTENHHDGDIENYASSKIVLEQYDIERIEKKLIGMCLEKAKEDALTILAEHHLRNRGIEL